MSGIECLDASSASTFCVTTSASPSEGAASSSSYSLHLDKVLILFSLNATLRRLASEYWRYTPVTSLKAVALALLLARSTADQRNHRPRTLIFNKPADHYRGHICKQP